MTSTAIPLSLYAHWPWCVRKCPYCDFNSHALPKSDDFTHQYIDALIADLERSVSYAQNRPLVSLFIGGGTPSLIPPFELERFLEAVCKLYKISDDIEITLEANPGTVDMANFKTYRSLGINRLSMGIQSFNDDLLKRLGRIHNRQEALKAIEIAQDNFENFNLDVMFALPGQTLQELEFELQQAVNVQSTHLSFYQLTLEPNTVFAKHVPDGIPDADTIYQMQDLVVRTLEAAGFDHYEVSGYAKPGKRCRHNLNYWQFGDYLACGAGAHSKVTLEDGTILREARFMQPGSFINHALRANAVANQRIVSKEEQAFEFMLNVLRLREGVPLELLAERTALTLDDIQASVLKAQKLGLMPSPLTRFVTTAKGWDFLSDTQELFL
ncbi:MAG TPA: radical SAM family heme chaperone HemW [Candidatus Aphodousia faecigallinarum]|uniref:Heme chaperone HemW n=1 Tax=Candidatus Aphodousia faecigallinarum TaxID=2840677 RepID=A0A9D1IJF6_9BURK|nr:radical SAM family heme chaperone HemW [Candidatus Aphodousia faecigallinarum]